MSSKSGNIDSVFTSVRGLKNHAIEVEKALDENMHLLKYLQEQFSKTQVSHSSN